jgi:hypothetical protein
MVGFLFSCWLWGCSPNPPPPPIMLGAVRVEIVPDADIQQTCEQAMRMGARPKLLGCAIKEPSGIVVYSTASVDVLLHELDHAFNEKWCHDEEGSPSVCAGAQ